MKYFKNISFLFLLTLGLIVSGCGGVGGSDVAAKSDFTFTGATAPGAQTGTVVANFFRPQATLNVPTNTAEISFRFFNGPDGTGTQLQYELRDFATTITIDNVSTTVQSVIVRAMAADGSVLMQATTNLTVLAGETVTLDFAGAAVEFPVVSLVRAIPTTTTISYAETVSFTAEAYDQFGQQLTLGAGDVTWAVTSGTSATIGTTDGMAVGIGIGQSLITATVSGVSGSASLTVNAVDAPAVTLDTGLLTLRLSDPATPAFPGATVTSPLTDLQYGTLTVTTAASGLQDVTFVLPNTPAIGVITNNGTGTVSVDLDTNATPANIQTVLQGTTVSPGTTMGMGQLAVTLTDGVSTVTANRDYEVANNAGITQLPDNGFTDITGMGGVSTFALSDDNSTPYDIGFDFTLFGVNWRNLHISSNGVLALTPFGTFSNGSFPGAGLPDLIAPYWDDLDPRGGDLVYAITMGTAPNRYTIIQWENFDHFSQPSPEETFQVVLYETTNVLEFHYESTSEGGSGATVGVQSNAGAEFYLWSFNSNQIYNGLSLQIYAP